MIAGTGFGQEGPPTIPREQVLRERKDFLNRKILMAARILKHLDLGSVGVHVSEYGTVTPPESLRLPYGTSQEEISMSQSIATQIERSSQKANAEIPALRSSNQLIRTVAIINGALVATYDSSQAGGENMEVLGLKGSKKALAKYLPADQMHPAVIILDLNRVKYGKQQTFSSVLLHELGHHNAELVRQALAQQGDFQLKAASPLLSQPLDADWHQYKALLERGAHLVHIPEHEVISIREQQLYLHEMHSHFLAGQEYYFNLNNKKAYNNIRDGAHHELVGLNEDDQKAGQELIGYVQAAMIIDNVLFNDTDKRVKKLLRLTPEWVDYYTDVLGIIGASLTVKQARELVGERWSGFMQTHKNFIGFQERMILNMNLDHYSRRDFGLAGNLYEILGIEKHPARRGKLFGFI